jgi:hypothetical protein
MNAKLTLVMDRAVVRRMKTYAVCNGRSISRIAEGYFRRFTEGRHAGAPALTGVVAELAGILRSARSAVRKTHCRHPIVGAAQRDGELPRQRVRPRVTGSVHTAWPRDFVSSLGSLRDTAFGRTTDGARRGGKRRHIARTRDNTRHRQCT